jgi:hypothetical protein
MSLFGKKKKSASVAPVTTGAQPRPETKESVQQIKLTASTSVEKTIILFDDRKKTSKPSKNGLYVAEILLLDYCRRGKYPMSNNDYPKFWLYDYGIANVREALLSLETRGFIRLKTGREMLDTLTVPQLKLLLEEAGQPTTGKKADLLARLSDTVTDEFLDKTIKLKVYTLTPEGQTELDDNQYVPYMHRNHNLYTFHHEYKEPLTVWTLNQRFSEDDKRQYKDILDAELEAFYVWEDAQIEQFLQQIRGFDPAGYDRILNGIPEILLYDDPESKPKRTAKEEKSKNNFLINYITEIQIYDKLIFHLHNKTLRISIDKELYTDTLIRLLNAYDAYKHWAYSLGQPGQLWFDDSVDAFSRNKTQEEYLKAKE